MTERAAHASTPDNSTRAGRFGRDVVAGLSVAVVELPQAMAYALIAGVSPVYGIYTSVIQGFVGSLLCANRHVRTGPTNTQALLVASVMANLAAFGAGEYLLLVATLTFLKGVIQIIASLLRAGHLFRFVSPSTVVGISAGAGVLIIAGQLPALIGMTRGSDQGWPGLPGQVCAMASASNVYDRRALGIGLGCAAIILVLSRIHRLIPSALIAVGAACAVVFAMNWSGEIPVVGDIPRALPELIVPTTGLFDLRVGALVGGAAALAVLGMIEAVAIGRTLADPHDRRSAASQANRELLAQGVANLVSSPVGAIPGSASFSRSLLDRAAGAATRASGPIGALAVAILALLFAPLGRHLPYAALAGVLVVIAARLIDFRYIAQLFRHHRPDFVVCVVTLASTLLLPLQYAVFVGIGLNLVLQLLVASRLRASELVPTADGAGFRESAQLASATDQAIRVVQLDGNLFFALRDSLDELLGTLERSNARVVILRLRNTHSIDASVLDAIASFVQRMHTADRHVLLCGLRQPVLELLRADRRIGAIASDRPVLFAGGDELLRSLGNAMNQARSLLGEPPAPTESERDWVYVI